MSDSAGRFPHVPSILPWLQPMPSWAHLTRSAHQCASCNPATPAVLIAVLYLMLPNLPVLVASGTLCGLPHGIVNVECLAIGAVGLFLPRRMVFVLLLMESILDFSYSICYTYRFTLGDLLTSLSCLSSLPALRLLEGFAVLFFSAILSAALSMARPRRRMRARAISAMLAFAVLASAIDLVDGQNFLWRKDATLTPYRLARSPLLVLAMWETSSIRKGADARTATNLPMKSASAEAISFLSREPKNADSPNVVLILVESWGLPLDSQLANGLTQPFGDPRLRNDYEVSSGAVPFSGLTVPGEARELCHSTAGFEILNRASAMASNCLPALFHQRGYENLAVHGFLGQMFHRNVWYPQLGFDQSVFKPDLEELGLPDCPGAFPGTCDTSIAEWIGRRLQTPASKPRFIYWVTLNSHLPEPSHPNLPDDGLCATEVQLQSSSALCSWFRLVRAEHQAVEKMALLQTARPTLFILVGDHAPPFSNPALRAQFSSTEVPFVMLMPKDLIASQEPSGEPKGRRK